MDNLVMIQAGDAIDQSFGVTFALSTMTAAGFGQIFSDIAGITCGAARAHSTRTHKHTQPRISTQTR